ncbi:hypothetical protein GARC_4169 [Paraglaciecola arctica BSs20135]|uniref:Uncharacterized protein n=1 Tax=Paraglaciecola arctica BSs20135 TaxID=493475 RepID=K6YAW9_9ALTE|nr:hypothetical protein GARC_4169 [Paraglaciecola arctica BSs20135]
MEQLLTHGNSESSIRAIFPSYEQNLCKGDRKNVNNPESECVDENEKVFFDLEGDYFQIYLATAKIDLQDLRKNKKPYAKVKITDILETPNNGFKLHLYINNNNEVVASIGDKSVLSIVNVNNISQIIASQQNLDWSSLTSKGSPSTSSKSEPLPGYSNYVDFKLTSHDYRLFIYPIQLNSKLNFLNEKEVSNANNVFIIGVLPKTLLNTQANQRWNISLLAIVLILLLFAWMMLRLFLLSNHQPVGKLFFCCTMFCSYMLFVMMVSFYIALNEKSIEQENKTSLAGELMKSVSSQLEQELWDIQQQIESYHHYYGNLLDLEQQNTAHDITNALVTFPVSDNSSSCDVPSVYSTLINGYYTTNLIGTSIADSALINDSSSINLFSRHARNKSNKSNNSYDIWFDYDRVNSDSYILSTLLLDDKGKQLFPRLYNIESNKKPKSQTLANREYFKHVRDQQGWKVGLRCFYCTCPTDSHHIDLIENYEVSNFYIQRLRNIGDGTKGTTIALPLAVSELPALSDTQYIFTADIELPSLNLMEIDEGKLQDFSLMVVNRDNGNVLFHLDENRSLIENLFEFGQGTEKIAHRIRTGISNKNSWIDGFYHGVAGQFGLQKLVIDQWVLVIFIPDESLNTYMTNIFMFNTISISTCLLGIFLVLWLLQRFNATYKLKNWLDIPLTIDLRKVMVFNSVFISTIFIGYWLGQALDRGSNHSQFQLFDLHSSFLLSSAFAILCLLWGFGEYRRFYVNSRQAQKRPINIANGAKVLVLLHLFIGGLCYSYLDSVGMTSASGLKWYYEKNVYPARLNNEYIELNKIALSRYPNTITQHKTNALDLLPISPEWRERLSTEKRKAYTSPVDVKSYSHLISTGNAQSWFNRYLFKSTANTSKLKRLQAVTFSSIALPMLTFILLCFVWVRFNRRILSVRLYGSPQYLRHLYQMAKTPSSQFKPSENLVMNLVEEPEGGHNLAMLLQLYNCDSEQLPKEFATLFNASPLFKELAKEQRETKTDLLPNMKISMQTLKSANHIKLWDIEISLQQVKHRAVLLRILNHCKSLLLSGHLKSLTLFGGFHSLQRLCIKDSMLTQDLLPVRQMDAGEYFAWAECLMDFSVEIPNQLTQQLDINFIQNEIKAFPMLAFMQKDLGDTQDQNPYDFARWLDLKEWQKSHQEWASINYILLKAEALYRFKWESCSSAEKLTLYHLALNKRINPANVQMYEHLALNGLIVVKRGRIRIVNQSFAYFVRYAEDKETLKKLISRGDVGKWQEYRLPITLSILAIIGGIALTSGNSLYMIVASAMGVLGTIGSLTNSASLIRSNLQK